MKKKIYISSCVREIISWVKFETLATWNLWSYTNSWLKSYHNIFPQTRIKINFSFYREQIDTNSMQTIRPIALGYLLQSCMPRNNSWENCRCYFLACVIIWSLSDVSFLASHVLELLQQKICPQISLHWLFLITSCSTEEKGNLRFYFSFCFHGHGFLILKGIKIHCLH